MKNAFLLLMTFVAITFSSCEGPQGPPGSPGQDGGLEFAQAFEIILNFNATNNYEVIEAYGFDVFPSDVTLVYILWEIVDGQDVWRLLPQTVEFEDGTLVYNFDFTQSDVRFFLDGTTNLDRLDPIWTQNQVFRVVVIPAENNGRLDYSNLDTVMAAYGIETFEKRH